MSKKNLTLQLSCLFVVSLLMADLLARPMAIEAQSDPTTFSGEAAAVKGTVLGTPIAVSDTGPLPRSGGALQASLLTVSVPNLLTANVAHAATIGQGDRTRSEASLASLNLNVAGNSISASFLMARATAVCGSGGPTVTGSSQVADLAIDGQAIVVSDAPNQTIILPNGAGEVIINEQQSSVSGNTGTITVNALHIVINGLGDIIISSAHADITCGALACQGSDFVTGGGWITSPTGAKANFAVAGGINFGHLEYIDHGTGMKVHGTGVTAYVITGPTSRHIEGTADIDGQSGFTYAVDVADNGEPGVGVDTFAIDLSNGYSAGGTLGGGNIQLHHPCR